MSNGETPADLPLLDTLNKGLHQRPLYVKALWAALRQDVPHLDQILEREAAKKTAHSGYINVAYHAFSTRENTSLHQPVHNISRLDFTYDNIPLSSDTSAEYRRFHQSQNITPHIMIMKQGAFEKFLSAPDRHRIASRLMADMFQSNTYNHYVDLYLDPAISARIEAVIDLADASEVARMIEFRNNRRDPTISFYESLGQKQDPTLSKLSKFFGEVKDAGHQAWFSETPNSDKMRFPKEKEPETGDLLVPGNGATVMLLDARDKISNLIRRFDPGWSKENRGKKRDLVIFEDPALWAAVRNTASQDTFARTLIGLDAMSGGSKPKTADTPEPQPLGNQLLAGLDEAGVKPDKTDNRTKRDIAFDAMIGYLDSVSSIDDLNAFLTEFTSNRSIEHSIALNKGFLDAISRAAAKINYSARDALELSDYNGVNFSYSKNNVVMPALNGGRWTLSDFDQAITQRPILNHPENAGDILTSGLLSDPKAIATLSDGAILKLARTMQLVFPKSLLIDETFSATIQKRISALPLAQQSTILARWTRDDWAAYEKPIKLNYLKAMLSAIPAHERLDFLDRTYNISGSHNFYRKTVGALEPADQVFAQDRLIEEYNASKGYRHTVGDAIQLKALLGYDSHFDKQATLAKLDPDLLRRDLSFVISQTLSSSYPGMQKGAASSHFYGVGSSSDDSYKIDLNLAKNMAFDLHEKISETMQDQTVVLTGHDAIVRAGIGRQGDTLTWEGFSHLVAPFLEDPRPALASIAPTNAHAAVEATPETDAPAASDLPHVFDKDAIKSKLTRGYEDPYAYPMMHGMRGGRHDMRHMRSEVTGVGVEILREALTGRGHRGASLERVFAMAPTFGITASEIQEDIHRIVASQALDTFKRNDWFKTEAPVAEQKAEAAATKTQSISIK